jgi:hypothetical protein
MQSPALLSLQWLQEQAPQLYGLVTGTEGELSLLHNPARSSFVWLKVTIQGKPQLW